jgi:hypothetical protein
MNATIRTALAGTLLTCLSSLPLSSAAEAAPYQRYQNGTCAVGPTICNIDFPVVPANRRLIVTSVSCYLRTSSDRDLYAMQLLVVVPGGLGSAVTIVPQTVDSISATGDLVWSANHTVVAFANAGSRMRAYTELKAGSIRQFACHISGDLQAL